MKSKNWNSDDVLFYSEKLMRDGKMHFSVVCYDNVSTVLTYPSDVMEVYKGK